jgi:hypothetical protein
MRYKLIQWVSSSSSSADALAGEIASVAVAALSAIFAVGNSDGISVAHDNKERSYSICKVWICIINAQCSDHICNILYTHTSALRLGLLKAFAVRLVVAVLTMHEITSSLQALATCT